MAAAALAREKGGATRRGLWLVHVDESGFSERPPVRRTWAPQGETPVLEVAGANWKRVSALAALALSPRRDRVRVLLQYHLGSVSSAEVVAFLQGLHRHLRGRILLVWDRLSQHLSAETRAYLAEEAAWLEVELLPKYAPELNPVEQLWSYLKAGDLVHFVPEHLGEIPEQVERRLRTVRRKGLAWSFLAHSGLYPSLRH